VLILALSTRRSHMPRGSGLVAAYACRSQRDEHEPTARPVRGTADGVGRPSWRHGRRLLCVRAPKHPGKPGRATDRRTRSHGRQERGRLRRPPARFPCSAVTSAAAGPMAWHGRLRRRNFRSVREMKPRSATQGGGLRVSGRSRADQASPISARLSRSSVISGSSSGRMRARRSTVALSSARASP